MARVCNLKSVEQLRIIERIAHNLQKIEFDGDIEKEFGKVLGSHVEDLKDALRYDPRTALDYGADTFSLTLTIVDTIAQEKVLEWFTKNKLPKSFIKAYELTDSITQGVKDALLDPVNYSGGEIRFCDECGAFMKQGYTLAAEEYYCSDECLHKSYTKDEYMTMYAGLDNSDLEKVRLVSKMTQQEIQALHEKNKSECYWTEWEVQE